MLRLGTGQQLLQLSNVRVELRSRAAVALLFLKTMPCTMRRSKVSSSADCCETLAVRSIIVRSLVARKGAGAESSCAAVFTSQRRGRCS